jgi:hypothetical protein
MSTLRTEYLQTLDSAVTIAIRELYQKKIERISVKDAPFNAVGDGVTDDTAAIQAAFNYIVANTSAGLTTSGSLTTSFSGTSPRLYFPKGTYLVTGTVTLGSYLDVLGDDAIIKMDNSALDIWTCLAYQVRIEGMQFVGGRVQLDIFNANINSSMIDIYHCQFFLSSSYAVVTRAIPQPVAPFTVWSHLSADFNLYKCRFITCANSIDNVCDNMSVRNCWIQPGKSNWTSNSAVIRNRGVSVTDPNVLTRMHLEDCFLIPDVGTVGVDRVPSVRWVDNYGSFSATNCRFGGEEGGIPTVFQQGSYNASFPWSATSVHLEDCVVFNGPGTLTDSCVVGLFNAVPQRFSMVNCTGPAGKPIVVNLSSMDIAAYMVAFEAATGRKAYEYFKVNIDDIIHDTNIQSPLRPLIPASLQPFVNKGRQTKLRKQNQSISNALASNLVSFDTVTFDNIGAFVSANPTQLLMPNGCSKMRITVQVVMAVDGAAKFMDVQIVDSGGNFIAGNSELRGINPEADRFNITAEVDGPPSSFWNVRIRHNAAGALNMTDCRVTLVPIDYCG